MIRQSVREILARGIIEVIGVDPERKNGKAWGGWIDVVFDKLRGEPAQVITSGPIVRSVDLYPQANLAFGDRADFCEQHLNGESSARIVMRRQVGEGLLDVREHSLQQVCTEPDSAPAEDACRRNE